jgi:hypothetical protein
MLDQGSGSDVLVKETNGHSMEQALYRLDRIQEIIRSGSVPGWIDVPDHYGVVTGKHLPHQYLLMNGIDSGINVDHIKRFEKLTAIERLGVEEAFGRVTESVRDEVLKGYDEAYDVLSNAIADADEVPTRLLTDWHERNVVIEPLVEPIDGHNFRYWVIDQ